MKYPWYQKIKITIGLLLGGAYTETFDPPATIYTDPCG